MRREKRLAENEERYRAEQDRRRTAKHKRNSNPSPGLDADHPLGDGHSGGCARVMPVARSPVFFSAGGK